jgi:hypothetical protein
MDSMNMLLDLACEWAEGQQDYILQNGAALSESQMNDARLAGVSCPEKVRLLDVDQIPWPDNATLESIGREAGFITDYTEGLTLGYGIFLRSGSAQARRLVVHELVHVAQCERLGGIEQFLQRYVTGCLSFGYHNAPMEEEAVEIAARICEE